MAWSGRLVRVALLATGVASGARSVAAQDFPAPTDRNHTIDMYLGTAIGSARIIGMGGTATATAQGSSGMLANPAAPGVRPTTSNDTWDWDWHLDSQSPAFGSDYDNNGIKTEDVSFNPNVTFGAALQYKDWGLGFTAIAQRSEALGEDQDRVASEAVVSKVALSHFVLDGQLVVGAGIKGVLLSVTSNEGGDQQTLLELSGASVEGGVLWKGNQENWRLAAAYSLPVLSDTDNAIENCDPLDCAGYVLPNKIKVPWQASLGVAWRQGPTAWNQQVKSRWRDEKALLWAADLVLTGATRRGIGLEAFAQHKVQPSGRTADLSVRGGVEYEWFPGRFRVRGGTYYEPGRFRDADGEDISGRAHITLGFDWRFWSFDIWGQGYRLQLAFTADAAENFGNSGLALGFWH